MTTVDLPAPETTDAGYFDLDAALLALEQGQPVRFPPFEVVHFRGMTFCLNFRDDPIQNCLRNGRFYERNDLRELAAMVRPGAYILDVGANIGNHAVFFARRMKAARVVVVEPNPLALAPLLANIVLNRLEKVIDTGALGVGLGAEGAGGFSMRHHDRNLSATKLRPGGGTLRVVAGDALFEDERFDFIKIDVEGMEMEVLAGLEATIARCRPLMQVEVDVANEAAFAAWTAAYGYEVLRISKVSRGNNNHLVRPIGAAAEGAPVTPREEKAR